MNLDDHPFMKLIAKVRTGALTIDQGEREAAQPPIVAVIEPQLVGGLSEASFNAASRGQWYEAQAVQRLLVAAVDQLADDRTASLNYKRRQIAIGDWVEIAHVALVHMASPDGRLLRAARTKGEHALGRALEVGHPETAGTLHFRLATLHLDPYKARASPLTGPFQGQSPWRASFNRELGDTVLGVGPDGWEMPEPQAAIQYAAEHLRHAVAGQWRHPRAAKALAQTLDTLISLGEPVDVQELFESCRIALASLDPVSDQAIFEEVSEILARRS
jgi:hypothetical protein